MVAPFGITGTMFLEGAEQVTFISLWFEQMWQGRKARERSSAMSLFERLPCAFEYCYSTATDVATPIDYSKK
jgi:hypothetical protein